MLVKSKSLRFAIVLLSLVAMLGACAQAASPTSVVREVVVEKESMYAPEEPAMEAPAPGFADEESYASANSTGAQVERIVIKNADLSIVVSDPVESMDTIASMAEEMGGFVVNANMYKQELEGGLQVPRASITIRVPAEKLNDALARIKDQSDQVPLSENLNSQDVTDDYVDLQSRLKNLQAAEEKLQEIMDEARKTEDVLSVYNELVRVREEIEIIQGRIKYYEQAAALSSVSVELIADEAVQPLTIGGWQPVGVAKNAIQALIDTLEFIATAVIWIVSYVLPVLVVLYLIFVLPLTLLWRAWRKRRARRKAAAPPQEPQADE